MATLTFFPWLKIEEEVTYGQYVMLPYKRGEEPGGVGTELQQQLDKILEPYVERGEQPVERATLLRLTSRELTDDLSDDEVNALFVFKELLTLCGLSARRFFSPGGLEYCNSDLFELRVQTYSKAGGGVTLRHRRRDGTTTAFVSEGAYRIHKPHHIMAPFRVTFDDTLLLALLEAQEALEDEEWGPIYESISNFNLANTDGDGVPLHLEVVFTVAAFERLLGVGGDGAGLARAFAAFLAPDEEISPQECDRLADRQVLTGAFDGIRELWMRDFYNVRSNMAHGKIESRYPALWLTRDHLLLSSLAYPLTLKCKLEREGLYEMTSDDRLHVDVFEQLACEEHTRPRDPDADEPGEFAWSRIIGDEVIRRAFPGPID